jgi:hypothetical protein
METIWFLAFLVQYGALVAGGALVGALVASTVYELVRNKMCEGSVFGSASVQKPVKGSAL